MKSFVLGCLLLLPGAAWGQNETRSALTAREQRLISNVLTLSGTGKPKEARKAILAQPEVAEHSFRILLTTVGDLDGSDRRLVLAYMNFVARVMESQGHGADMASLRAFHLLAEPGAGPSPSP